MRFSFGTVIRGGGTGRTSWIYWHYFSHVNINNTIVLKLLKLFYVWYFFTIIYSSLILKTLNGGGCSYLTLNNQFWLLGKMLQKKPSEESWKWKQKQAGAELCQAQVKLGWAKNLLPINRKLRSLSFTQKRLSSIYKKTDITFVLDEGGKLEVVFHLPNKLRLSSICLKNWGRFHLPKKLRSSFICLKICCCLPFAE